MIRWNLFFEVEKVEQLALIDRLATHHDRPPSLKASGKRNHDSSISTRPFSTGSAKSGQTHRSKRIQAIRDNATRSVITPLPILSFLSREVSPHERKSKPPGE